ncbi:hypothetical protein M407DRAFT_44095, partial [Tulasnella calospora MUT 4182]
VTINDLNKPLNEHLRAEELRLDALAVNTLIKYGFAQGSLIPVPNPEFEQKHLTIVPELSFSFNEDTQSRKRKPKRHGAETLPEKRKKTTIDHCSPEIPKCLPFPCPNWDSENYSCAYDSVFAILLSAYHRSVENFRTRFASHCSGSSMLMGLFQQVLDGQI